METTKKSVDDIIALEIDKNTVREMFSWIRNTKSFLKDIDDLKQTFTMTVASLSQESISITADAFKDKLHVLGSLLTDKMREFLLKAITSEDSIRYYRITTGMYTYNYVAISTGTVRGKYDNVPESAVAVNYTEIQECADDNGELAIEHIEVGIVVGLNDPAVTVKSLPHLVKHELAHTLLDVIIWENPEKFDEFKSSVGEEIYDYFIEFMCDYIQFDYLVMNRYVPKPIPTFREWMSETKTKEVGAYYAKFVDAIESLYDTTS